MTYSNYVALFVATCAMALAQPQSLAQTPPKKAPPKAQQKPATATHQALLDVPTRQVELKVSPAGEFLAGSAPFMGGMYTATGEQGSAGGMVSLSGDWRNVTLDLAGLPDIPGERGFRLAVQTSATNKAEAGVNLMFAMSVKTLAISPDGLVFSPANRAIDPSGQYITVRIRGRAFPTFDPAKVAVVVTDSSGAERPLQLTERGDYVLSSIKRAETLIVSVADREQGTKTEKKLFVYLRGNEPGLVMYQFYDGR